jgi:hypothetical protein
VADVVKIFTKLGLAAKQGFIDLGFGNYKPIDEVIKNIGGNIMEQGLRYSDDATTNQIINQYLSNISRGSALTKGAKHLEN